jgi:hypothetical protein
MAHSFGWSDGAGGGGGVDPQLTADTALVCTSVHGSREKRLGL